MVVMVRAELPLKLYETGVAPVTSRVAESAERRPDTAFLAKSREVCLWQAEASIAVS